MRKVSGDTIQNESFSHTGRTCSVNHDGQQVRHHDGDQKGDDDDYDKIFLIERKKCILFLKFFVFLGANY